MANKWDKKYTDIGNCDYCLKEDVKTMITTDENQVCYGCSRSNNG